MLSNDDYLAWDFTSSLTSIYGKSGQSETFTLNDGATRSDTNGLELITTNDDARLSCANGGVLSGWTYPFTMVLILEPQSNPGTTNIPMFQRLDSSNAELVGGRFNNATPISVFIRHNTQSASLNLIASNMAVGNQTIAVMEARADGGSIWYNNTLHGNVTSQSNTMPTLSTTDNIWIGPNANLNPGVYVHGAAIVKGTISAGDRAAIQANWRTAFAPASTTAPRPLVNGGIITSLVNGGLVR